MNYVEIDTRAGWAYRCCSAMDLGTLTEKGGWTLLGVFGSEDPTFLLGKPKPKPKAEEPAK